MIYNKPVETLISLQKYSTLAVKENYKKYLNKSRTEIKVDIYLKLIDVYKYSPQYLEIDKRIEFLNIKKRIINVDIAYYNYSLEPILYLFINKNIKKVFMDLEYINQKSLEFIVFVNENIKSIEYKKYSNYNEWKKGKYAVIRNIPAIHVLKT